MLCLAVFGRAASNVMSGLVSGSRDSSPSAVMKLFPMRISRKRSPVLALDNCVQLAQQSVRFGGALAAKKPSIHLDTVSGPTAS
jgi:hypothetical protein